MRSKRMKKGQIAEGNVTTVEFPNKGIVMTDEGERVIVKNTIPGQRVSFAVNKVRKGKAEGRLLETVKKSPRETADTCRHFGQCGGCTYQSLPYEEQLKIKETQVRGMIEQAIGDACAYEFLPIRHSPRVLAYRNKMEFSFGDEYKDGPLALGMHKRGSFYDIVTVEDCRIVDGDFRAILMATLAYFREQEIFFYHRLRHTGYLRHLLVRKAVKTGEILVDLITTTQDWRNVQEQAPDERAKIEAALLEKQGRCPHAGTVNEEKEKQLLAGWKDVLLALSLEGTLKGVLHTKNDSVADVVKNEGTEVLFGQDYFYEELLGLRFQISPFSFFQTNSLGAEVLYSTAREFILGDNPDMLADKTVYDLYSGTGTIAQMLAPVCKKVVGVEIIEEAVEAAKENAALNHLDNCEFLAGDVLKVLDTIEERPDYIVLDPPRDGIHPKALEKIINYGVDHMIYISCKPTSLARDLEVLLARGYVVDKVQCVDMFPNTVHVETVVLLSQLKQKPDDYINVTIELDDVDITSAETKATYDEIKKYVFEHNAGMKVSNLYISQVKRKCGIEVGKNLRVATRRMDCLQGNSTTAATDLELVPSPNLLKKEDSRQPQCPEDKERAIVEALEHFKMIQQK